MTNLFLSQEIKQTICFYCDNALNKEEEIELLAQMKVNPKMQVFFQNEKAFRLQIKNGLGRNPASPSLINAIRTQLNAI